MSRGLFGILFATLLSVPANAGDTPTAQFFLLEKGVRAESMGGAFTALSDDSGSLFSNPAGIATGGSRITASGFNQEVDDGQAIAFGSLMAIHHEPGSRYSLGLGGSALAISVPGYDQIGQPATGSRENDTSIRAAYAVKLGTLQLGVAPKVLRMSLKGPSRRLKTTTYAADAGAIWSPEFGMNRRLRFGAVVQNAGPTSDGKDVDAFPLPTSVRLGVSGTPFAWRGFTLAVDQESQRSDKWKNITHVGGEIALDWLRLRAGVSGDTVLERRTSIGLGLEFGRLTADFAYQLAGDGNVGASGLASLSYRFSRSALADGPKLDIKARPDHKLQVAVINFDSRGLSEPEAVAISDFFRDGVINSNVFRVVERNDMRKILSEIRFQLTGCTSTECAARVGKMLNVERMFTGSISELDGQYYLTVRLVTVETGEIEGSLSGDADSLTGLKAVAERLAEQFAAAVRPK